MNCSVRNRFVAVGLAISMVAGMTSFATAAGVTVGGSTLFTDLDYGDTFTGTDDGGLAARPYVPAVQPAAAYAVETIGFNAPSPISFQAAAFSFAADAQPGAPGFVAGVNGYPTGITNASGAGSDTGFTQTGGAVDYGLAYGLRDQYVVQVDAVQTPDRIDISSGATGAIFGLNSLSVFFRGDGSGNASLFNGAVDTPIQGEIPAFSTGITGAGQWNNYAVRYNQPGNEIEIYVNEVSKGVIDLTTFAGGIYQGFSNAIVGAGGSGGDRVWTDNFQVGGNGVLPVPPQPYPDPGNITNAPAGLISFWDFDEGDGPNGDGVINFAYDRVGNNDGSFVGTATRTEGLGTGAALLDGVVGSGVDVGSSISSSTSLTIEALFTTDWSGNSLREFFRKEDGNNRILLSFQPAANINSATTIGTPGTPGISLGLNVGGYGELDIAFDGLDGRPTVADVADGNPHHIAATYDMATGVKSIYLDGALIGSVDLGDNIPLVSGGGAAAFIGASTGGFEPFTGVLDEVAFYNVALSQAEIEVHIQNVLAGNNYFVPEPSTMMLALFGLLGFAGRRRSRQS